MNFINWISKLTTTREEVDEKWNLLLEFEAKLMKNLGTSETIHG
mgnify:CR=1 FL=1